MAVPNHKLVVWNVRGLNAPGRRHGVRELVRSTGAVLVCLQETKLASISLSHVMQFLGNEFRDFVYLPAVGTRGGILLAWVASEVTVSNPIIRDFSTSAQVSFGRVPWWFTGVYGPSSDVDADQVAFLAELRDVRRGCSGPWLVSRDFNMIYQAADKNNANVYRRSMGRFRRFLNDEELGEVPLNGRRFTWTKERERPTLERLDRVFCSASWAQLFPENLLCGLPTLISDHRPLLVHTEVVRSQLRRFHFEPFWPKLDGFMEAVVEAWAVPSSGSSLAYVLNDKLRTVCRRLQSWSSRQVGDIRLQIDCFVEHISRLEVAQESRLLSSLECWPRKNLKLKYLALCSLQRTIARLRARVSWLREGDANTSYFHFHAGSRRRRNFIAQLHHDGQDLVDQAQIEEAVTSFFEDIFESPEDRSCSLDFGSAGPEP